MIAPLVLAASLAAGLLVPTPVGAAPVEARGTDANAPVQFTGYFPSTITCGRGTNFGAGYLVGWEGGSGYYDFATILNYPHLPDTHPAVLLSNSTAHSYDWHAGACSGYPDGSTITFSIADAQYPPGETQWYQTSPAIPVGPAST